MNANDALAYTTSTDGLERDFRSADDRAFEADESDFYNDWCFVCSRPTDHRGEHDDLVAQSKASYDDVYGFVYYNP